MTTREAIEARLKRVDEAKRRGCAIPAGYYYGGVEGAVADIRTLLDALATVEAERDTANMRAMNAENVVAHAMKRAEAAEARAEALARAVREWQDADADVKRREAYYREIQDNEDRKSEKRAFDWPALSKASKRLDAAKAVLLALDVQESS